MKKNIKIIISIFIAISLNACFVSDDDVISTEDLLKGTWQINEYKENGITPNDFNSCTLLNTIEFTEVEMLVNEFEMEDATNNCILDSSYSYNYVVEDAIIKVNGMDIEIVDLTTTTLNIVFIENGNTITKNYEKLN